MEFNPPLVPGKLIRRYKRFLADIETPDGELLTVHCPNPGSMKACAEPGWEVRLQDSQNPKRKLRYTWELVHNGKCWIGINTQRSNPIVAEAIEKGQIPEIEGYSQVRAEVPYGENSRIDFLLQSEGIPDCYVEVKNVTLVETGDEAYRFPDSVTARGTKHLQELMRVAQTGARAVMLFTVQRSDGKIFRPADKIDQKYTATLRKAHDAGVEILPYQVEVSPSGLSIGKRIDFDLS